MKYYPQALLFTGVLLFSIIMSAPKPPAAHDILINQPIAESSVALDPGDAPTNEAPLAAPPKITTPLPALKTNSALAKAAQGNQVLYELNPEHYWPLASLTKLMTAVVARENIPDTESNVSRIKRMMIVSDNDAADELAGEIGLTAFVDRMNEKAATLGMTSTSFSDPSGLSYLNQSTVHDLDTLVTYILKRHPEVFQWSREKLLVIDGQTYTNINKFVNRSDFLGGKTGFTDEANGNLISLFATKSGPLIIIMLGAPNKTERFAQTETLLKWLSQRFKL